MAASAEAPNDDADTVASPATARSISNAVARLHKQFVGRGPKNTTTTLGPDLVVCVLEGGLTVAEQTLAGTRRHDLVTAQRVGLREAMREAMVAAVEEVTGRRVRSYMSATDHDVMLQTEIFLLFPEVQ